MNRAILMVMALLIMATSAEAENQIYSVDGGMALENAGYKLFVSDKIIDTVERIDNGSGKDMSAGFCSKADEDIAKNLGAIDTIRSDARLSIPVRANISYSAACSTYYSVLGRLKTADDVRRLWLLFGDSVTDNFAVETLKKRGPNKEIDSEVSLLIETKRLAVVSEYIEFFYTKNQEWKLTDYTFLSQAFKSRKGKSLSPSYIQFIQALLTGDSERAFQVVKSIDLDNLGTRFSAPGAGNRMKKDKSDALIQTRR